MPQDIRDSFSKSGTAHLLAISGGNIALVALCGIVIFRLLYVPRKIIFALTILLLVFYFLFTGSAASILRATVMISIYLAGFLFRREPEVLSSLAWSAIFILVWDPLQLFDLGFQLSFISVFMIAAAMEGWKDSKADFKPGLFKKAFTYLEQSVTVSLAAWVGVMPLIAQIFGLVSPVTIFANLILVPYFSLLQTSGFMFLAFGSLNKRLEEVLGISFSLVCQGALALSDWFVSWPGSYFAVRPPGNFEVTIFYVIILLWAFRRSLRRMIESDVR